MLHIDKVRSTVGAYARAARPRVHLATVLSASLWPLLKQTLSPSCPYLSDRSAADATTKHKAASLHSRASQIRQNPLAGSFAGVASHAHRAEVGAPELCR